MNEATTEDRERRKETLREWLSMIGYYPTETGIEMAQEPRDKAVIRQGLRENLDKLEPGDLFAISVLVSTLACDRPTHEDVLEHTDARMAFLDWVEAWPEGWERLNIRAAEVNGRTMSLLDLLNALEGSEDIMPSEFCDYVDLPQGSTYGDAVRRIRSELGGR